MGRKGSRDLYWSCDMIKNCIPEASGSPCDRCYDKNCSGSRYRDGIPVPPLSEATPTKRDNRGIGQASPHRYD